MIFRRKKNYFILIFLIIILIYSTKYSIIFNQPTVLPNNKSNLEFDFKHNCIIKNMKWKPLSLIYMNLKDQQEYFNSHFELIVHYYNLNSNITLNEMDIFKIEFNERSK